MILAKPASRASPAGRRIEVRISRRAYRAMRTSVFAILAVSAVLVLVMQMRLSAVIDAGLAIGENVRKFSPGNTGPWGEIQSLQINIERPDELLPLPTGEISPVRWYFDGITREQVASLFKRYGINENLSTALLSPQHSQTDLQGVVVIPGDKIIVELSPRDRASIYYLLSLSSRNPAQCMPYAFTGETFNNVFQKSDLNPDIQALVKQLLYERGKSTCFSDLDTVLRLFPSDHDRRRVIKTLSRQTTLLVRVRLSSQTDLDQLVQYWGGESRSKDLRPLLESLAASATTIDVAHLLPSLPRRLLYTYPYPSAGDSTAQNCFWTSFNFFNRQPISALAERDEVSKLLQSDYFIVSGQREFGDILLIACDDLGLVHTAVYVADNIVFTKNGGHYSKPWVLMKVDELVAAFPLPGKASIAWARRKPKSS